MAWGIRAGWDSRLCLRPGRRIRTRQLPPLAAERPWLRQTRLRSMNFLRRHWYEVGAVVAIGTTVWLILGWHDMGVLQQLLLLNFVVLLVHQYEEYGWPGGEPAI